MIKFLLFSMWVSGIGIAILWESPLIAMITIAVGLVLLSIWLLVVVCQEESGTSSDSFCQWTVAPELFLASPLSPTKPMFRNPELEQQMKQIEQAALQRKTMIYLPATALVIGSFFAMAISGWIVIAIALSGVLLVLLDYLSKWWETHCRKQLELSRQNALESFLAMHSRPLLMLENQQSRDHFCRYYETVSEAQIACGLANLLRVKPMIYPDDSFLLFAGHRLKSIQKQLHRCFQTKGEGETFGEVVQSLDLFRRKAKGLKPEATGWKPTERQEPPALSPTVEEVKRIIITNQNWNLLKEDNILKELEQRPAFLNRLFCSYWGSREEAEIALVIREIAIFEFGRPLLMFCYPNDPMAMLTYIADDSMESIDFILNLEERFKISIPDPEAEKLLKGSFMELVQYIRITQKA